MRIPNKDERIRLCEEMEIDSSLQVKVYTFMYGEKKNLLKMIPGNVQMGYNQKATDMHTPTYNFTKQTVNIPVPTKESVTCNTAMSILQATPGGYGYSASSELSSGDFVQSSQLTGNGITIQMSWKIVIV